jgi:long-chain acyl-CoA synthetase
MFFHDLLLDGAWRSPESTALSWLDRGVSLTYAQAVDAMERVAGALSGLGVERGDRVGVFAHNGLDCLLAMFGASRLGAIAALVNVQYADTLDYYFGDCAPKVVVYTGDHHHTIERHRSNLHGVRHYVCLDGPQDGALAWEELLATASPPPPFRGDESDVAHLSYTSGTSGDPKGVCLAHEPTLRATRCIAERLRIDSADVSVGPTALSSSYQLVANVLPPLHRGACVCVISRWDAAQGWKSVDKAEASILVANPSILTDVLDTSRDAGRLPGRLRVVVSGGAPVPHELKRRWVDEFGVTLAESYGQSELGGFVGLGSPEPLSDDRSGACGQMLPDKEVRILDDDGREVPVGVTGEICLRGGNMAGYWRRPEQTAHATRGGWLHTGDSGWMDADRYIYVRGRLSERIRIQDEYWYPRDLEELFARHPQIKEAALVALPSEDGDRPVAYVTARAGDVEPEQLLTFVRGEHGRVPPSLAIRVIDEMPMTPTGKINKARLIADAMPVLRDDVPI